MLDVVKMKKNDLFENWINNTKEAIGNENKISARVSNEFGEIYIENIIFA